MASKKSFEDFIVNNMDASYRYAYTFGKNREDAEDILNESILRAWRSVGALQNEQYMKTWFYKIITNTAITYLKKKGEFIALEDEELEKLDFIEDKYRDDSLDSMLSALPIKYKEIIVLRFFEEMSLQEISQVLSLNENTVKTRLYRGLKLLKADIERDVKWIKSEK